jgi:NAD+ synthase
MDCEKITLQLVTWLQERVQEAGAQGLVFGLSGGVDSALVAALAKKAFPDNCLGVIMPCHSQAEDQEDAELVAQALALPTLRVDLTSSYDSVLEALTKSLGTALTGLAASNIKPRLRMTTLYSIAAAHNYLVAGTGNRSEAYVGYFTKYGDGGTDLWPIAGLVKAQVWELSRYLGVPEKIVTKAPSAGLWPGQTDEGEIGFTYRELDTYLLTGQGSLPLIQKIEELHRKSAHKRALPPTPNLDS